ncbi:MAG: hypothetical protein ACJ8F7_03965 [Gemmataceae bacterium]
MPSFTRVAMTQFILFSIVPFAAGQTTDIHGDPLPRGAVARLGTVRFQPGGCVNSLAFSPDGSRLASVTNGDNICLWDVPNGRELRRVDLARIRVMALAWLADGRGFAVLKVAAGDEQCSVWSFTDPASVPPASPPPAGLGFVRQDYTTYDAFAISPDGKMVAGGLRGLKNGPMPIHAWDLAPGPLTPQGRRTVGALPSNCEVLLFSPDGKSLFALGRGKEHTAVVWDVPAGRERARWAVATTMEQRRAAMCAFSPNGDVLAMGGDDGVVRLWNKATGNLKKKFGANAEKVRALAFRGEELVAGGRDNQVRVWDPAAGRELRTMNGHASSVEAVAVSPDGSKIASAGQDGVMRIWDAAAGGDLGPQGGHTGLVWYAATSPDGQTILTQSPWTIQLWDAATGRPLHRLEMERGMWAFGFTPDGSTVLAGSRERTLAWDARTGKLAAVPAALSDHPASNVSFSRNGRIVMTALGRQVELRDWPTGRPRCHVELHQDRTKPGEAQCTVLRLSAGGETLLTQSHRYYESTPVPGGPKQGNVSDETIALWDARTGRLRRVITEPAPRYFQTDLTPDGDLLLGDQYNPPRPDGSPPAALRLVSPEGALRREFPDPTPGRNAAFRQVRRLALAPTGYLVASAEGDRVLLFEIATGQLRGVLSGHHGEVSALAFTPDGRRLISGSNDNTALVWDVTPTALAKPADGDPSRLWEQLTSSDAAVVGPAIAGLVSQPEATVKLIRDRLKPAAAPESALLDRLVADLGSDQFAARQKALAELEKLGEPALDGLQRRLAITESAEVRQKLSRLVDQLAPGQMPPERLRALRAIEVLEAIGTTAAQGHVAELAAGAPEALLTRTARSALDRWPK